VSAGRDSADAAEAFLAELGLADSDDARRLLGALVADPGRARSVLSAGRTEPKVAIPPLDELVERRMRELFPSCTEPDLLVKPHPMGPASRRLLGFLLAHVGEDVPLSTLLAVNEFQSATPRRLRELRNEHGGWQLESAGSGTQTTYRLESARPDVDACSWYWLRRNIRDSGLSPERRLVALLSARLGEAVALTDLEYVLPRATTAGRGRARATQAALTRRIRELRELGYQVQSSGTFARLGTSEYVLPTLDRIPEYERIPSKVRDERLRRDDFRCRQCGWGPEDGPAGRRRLLEVHHLDPQRSRPEEVHELSKLVTLCNVCHDAK
jgi:hypothetical protein